MFYQNAEFISGKHSGGHLCHISEDNKHTGFLSFLRFIGCLYFKKHYSAIASLKSIETPQQLFHSFPSKQHTAWYNAIRGIVSDRITQEEERMSSITAMWRHWLRSCWVANMWQKSTEEDLFRMLPRPETCGLLKHEHAMYTCDWESSEVQSRVKDTIDFLTKHAKGVSVWVQEKGESLWAWMPMPRLHQCKHRCIY